MRTVTSFHRDWHGRQFLVAAAPALSSQTKTKQTQPRLGQNLKKRTIQTQQGVGTKPHIEDK